MLELPVGPVGDELHRVRRTLRRQLGAAGCDERHVAAVESAANELLGAALEAGVRSSVTLTVEEFRLLTSVRVRCPQEVSLRDDPFGLRERVLAGTTLAFGRRGHADGSTDLWAEIARAP